MTHQAGAVIYGILYIAFIHKVCIFTLNTAPAIIHCYTCQDLESFIKETDAQDFRCNIYQDALSLFPSSTSALS